MGYGLSTLLKEAYTSSMSGKRMSGDKRSEAIVKAVLPVFANEGYHGSTVKNLAQAAGVSEALLYRHFPGKRELYAAAQIRSIRQLFKDKENVLSEEPSTEVLIHLIWYILNRMLIVSKNKRNKRDMVYRFIFRSYLEDGGFAKQVNQEVFGEFIDLMDRCIQHSHEVGDISSIYPNSTNACWFFQHIASHVVLTTLPQNGSCSYEGRKDALIQDICLFSLKGIGLNKKAIQRYLDYLQLSEWLYALK